MGALVGLGVGVGPAARLVGLPPAAQRRDRPRPGGTRAEQLLARAGARATCSVTSLGLLCVVLATVAFVVIQAVSRTVPVAVVFALMAGWAPVLVLRQRAARRQREFAEVWPDAVDNLASAVRAGMSLPDALGALGTNGPEALRDAFEAFALDYQVTGRFHESLDLLKARLADPVGDRVVEGLRIAREVGGGELGRLLRNLSGYLRDEARTRSELESRQAWTVNGARLAVSAPWVVLLLMSFQTGSVQAFSSPAGVLVLAVGAALLRRRLPGDDAHRPAARRAADPGMTLAMWGAVLGALAAGGLLLVVVRVLVHPPATARAARHAVRPRPAAGRSHPRAQGRLGVPDRGRGRDLRAVPALGRRRRRAGAGR